MRSVAQVFKEFLNDRDVVNQPNFSEQQRKRAFCRNAQALYRAMQIELSQYFISNQSCEVK